MLRQSLVAPVVSISAYPAPLILAPLSPVVQFPGLLVGSAHAALVSVDGLICVTRDCPASAVGSGTTGLAELLVTAKALPASTTPIAAKAIVRRGFRRARRSKVRSAIFTCTSFSWVFRSPSSCADLSAAFPSDRDLFW